MFYFSLIFWISIVLCVDAALYDRCTGKQQDVALEKGFRLKNATEKCSIEVKACTPHEGSRIDGTCNNFKHPAAGSAKGPYLRLLKPDYADKRDIRKDKNGDSLPSARKIRTTLEPTGRVSKTSFTSIAVTLLEFVHRDISFLDGYLDYLRQRQYCCEPRGETDPRCRPISVPSDDPYLKVTDIRCLNFSRARTYQDEGCTSDILHPEQINFQTPVLDLSTIYGVDDKALANVRKFEYGLLKLNRTVDKDRYVPFSNITGNSTEYTCYQNRQEKNETRCYLFGFPEAGNFGLRQTTLGIFFMREHNRIAEILHEINPCWKDDRLFKVARQINIATLAHIFVYELLPGLLGYRNMVNYGIISENVEQLTAYDEDAVPLVSTEFEIGLRFFHTFIDGRIKKYDENYHYNGEFSVSETLFRQNLLEENHNFEEINRGTFYQQAAKIDDIADPEISENFYGSLQKASDLVAIDIQRGRDLGVRGYIDYRELCGLKSAKKFEDFGDVMDYEKVEALKQLYHKVEDVDLLAGIMSENFIQGTYVGPTLFCIMAKQLQLFRFADRFWFERGDQVHSLSLIQLHEIRKTSMARFACDNAEAIKFIQPYAFRKVGPGNTPISCSHILGADLSKWRDDNCYKHKGYGGNYYEHKPNKDDRSNSYDAFFGDLMGYKKKYDDA